MKSLKVQLFSSTIETILLYRLVNQLNINKITNKKQTKYYVPLSIENSAKCQLEIKNMPYKGLYGNLPKITKTNCERQVWFSRSKQEIVH